MNEESEKTGLKSNIQKMKITAYGPITLWQIDGETVETVTDFIGDCSHEMKRCLIFGRKSMTNLDSILKCRDIILLMGFSGGSAGKESTCDVGDLGSIPGLGRSPGEGKGCPL